MTSSLVGSEMCIRDSALWAAKRFGYFITEPAAAYLTVEDRLAAEAAAAPVSYTHLTLPTICSV
eukprot:11162746-Prorocentrum_lima.AAC.1